MSSTSPRRRRGRPVDPVPRPAILEAAQEVFAERGYAGASMQAIATGCGVTKAALYNHFSSKEALYFAVLEDIATSLGDLVGRALDAEGDFLLRLDGLGEAVVRYLGVHQQAARLLSREMMEMGPFLSSPRAEVINEVIESTVHLLADGMTRGLIPEQDPRQLTGSIVGLHLHWFAAKALSGRLVGGDPFTPHLVDARVRAVQLQVRRMCGAQLPSV